ncbi:MAG: hypothetical protein LBM00_03880 [Deltaproteobacteria bacterium]|nr:hypothetical protein [Deltaproteobacteria bacterium]
MPVTKPLQISGGSGTPVVRKARQGATERTGAMNAALGVDNFARLLQQSPQAAVNAVKSRAGESARTLDAKPAYPGMDMGLGMPDARQYQGMSRIQKILQQSNMPLALVNSLNSLAGARPEGQEAAVLALRARSHKPRNEADAAQSAEQPVKEADAEPAGKIGLLSAMFESGKNGISAIGYDRMGGTSYGKYQLSSKMGTMDKFIEFLNEKAADFAERLKKAGAANTGSKEGQMPKIWRELAGEDPVRFAALQQEFISKTHFEPALAKIKELTGLDANKLSAGVREAIFSTAVQHGAGSAGRIVSRALGAVGLNGLTSGNMAETLAAEQKLVRNIYRNRSGQFASSGERVREAVQGRLKTEMNMVLDLLQNKEKLLG